jgi:hypothetical protein
VSLERGSAIVRVAHARRASRVLRDKPVGYQRADVHDQLPAGRSDWSTGALSASTKRGEGSNLEHLFAASTPRRGSSASLGRLRWSGRTPAPGEPVVYSAAPPFISGPASASDRDQTLAGPRAVKLRPGISPAAGAGRDCRGRSRPWKKRGVAGGSQGTSRCVQRC